MSGMCFNWKVVGGLAIVGLGIYALRPSLLTGALPLLAGLACPASMVFMMSAMRGQKRDGPSGSQQTKLPAGDTGGRLATLKEELGGLQASQSAISAQIAQLESERSAGVDIEPVGGRKF